MYPDEVITALGLKDGEYDTRLDGDTYSIDTEYILTVFGEKARVTFQFCDYTEAGKYMLHYIQVLYPDDIDMYAVRDRMFEIYGNNVSLEENAYSEYITRWEPEERVINMLSDDELTAYLYRAENADQFNPADFTTATITDEQRQQWRAEAEAIVQDLAPVYITWSDNFYLSYYPDMGSNEPFGTSYGLIFNAQYIQFLQDAQEALEVN